MVPETSDKMWPTGERNGKPLQYSCLENPINSMKRRKDMTLTLEGCPRPQVSRCPMCYCGEERKITPDRRKRPGHSRNSALLWMRLVREVKSDAVKTSIA